MIILMCIWLLLTFGWLARCQVCRICVSIGHIVSKTTHPIRYLDRPYKMIDIFHWNSFNSNIQGPYHESSFAFVYLESMKVSWKTIELIWVVSWKLTRVLWLVPAFHRSSYTTWIYRNENKAHAKQIFALMAVKVAVLR